MDSSDSFELKEGTRSVVLSSYLNNHGTLAEQGWAGVVKAVLLRGETHGRCWG